MRWRTKKDKKASKTKSPLRAYLPKEGENRPGTTTKKATASGSPKDDKEKRGNLSRLHRPADMSLEDWQIELRRQFGREQDFRLTNVGDQPFFSEFDIFNPQSQNNYRVHVRGYRPGDNFCSCPDFATNTLGTCKHIEFTLAALERKRGGKDALRAGFQPAYSEVYLQYGARREVRFRPGVDCPTSIARVAARYFGSDGALLADAFARFDTFLEELEPSEHEVRFQDDVLAFIAEVRDVERRREKVAEAFPRGARSAAFKDLLKVNLYDYQREGALFAVRAGRCLLGDDMGLGKTVQGIATAEILARLFGVERVLIVCPTSLKHQWQREIARYCDRSVEVIGGLRQHREPLYRTPTFFKITNYDTIFRDNDLIRDWGPDLVILDEAQRIKNWNTRVARSVKRITSPYALVLTGTPLENRLEELVSIVQFVDRFRLGPTFRLLNEHQIRDGDGKVTGYTGLDRIGKTLAPLLLRRHKNEVLDQLPERIDNNIFVPMTPRQRKFHSENRDIVARIVDKWRRFHFLTEAEQRQLMIALLRMRMSCDSSYLVDHATDHGSKADEAVMLLDEMLEEPGVKAVVFSQWTRMHELLERRMKGRDWDHILFHGGVPSTKRGDLIDRFRDDPNCRVFLSTDAGGVGLNLQHANVVVNMDLPWNPAVLEQRIGRVHRLGQKQPVRVVNFVTQGTIEEGMLQVLKFKKSLFAGVLDGGETEVFLGGSKLNKFMETVESATIAIPEELLEDSEDALRSMPDERGGKSYRSSRRRGATKPVPVAAPVSGLVAEIDDEPAPAAAASDPWSGLLQAGMALLQQFVAPKASGGTVPSVKGPRIPQMERDERTGERFVKLPVPSSEVIDQAVRALSGFLQQLRK
jgi:superfamily II DNA or RNA helicase